MKAFIKAAILSLPLWLATARGVPIPIQVSLSFDRHEDLSLRWNDLNAVLPQAARIPTTEGMGKHVWLTPVIAPESLIPNRDGQGYLVPLVVTPPADKRLAMAVCVVADPGCSPAGLLSPGGEEIKTTGHYQRAPYWFEDLQWTTSDRLAGFWIPAHDLTPGSEHVLLFACRPGAPASLRICVTFLPTEPASYKNEWSKISDYLGLNPLTGQKMAEVGNYRSAKIIKAFPALARNDSLSPITLDNLVASALSLKLPEPSEPWREKRNISLRSTYQQQQKPWYLEFASDVAACPTREEMVKLAGEPILSVSLDALRRHESGNPIKKALPRPEFSTADFDSTGMRVDYYDILAVVTNDASPAKVVATWTVGDFTRGKVLTGYQTFQLPGTSVRAFFIDGKCVGLVGSFGTDRAEKLLDVETPAGKYIEKTPDGETYAAFEYDGRSAWEALALYPGGKPRFRYDVTDNHLSGEVELWYFNGLQMEEPEESK